MQFTWMHMKFSDFFDNKGKGTQKYKWICLKVFGKPHILMNENCMKIRLLFFKVLRFYIFKMAIGHHFEINIKTENY